MNETKKEKLIRFVLIGFFILITIYAFFFRYDKQPEKIETHDPAAIVLKTGPDQNDDPIIALYEYKNNKHMLVVYKIERNNRYKFKTVHALELNNAPVLLSSDRIETGIWVHVNKKWIYYSEDLEIETRDTKYRNVDSPYKASFIFNKGTSKIVINENQSINWENSLGNPVEIHALTNDGLLWLVLTETGISIVTTETK